MKRSFERTKKSNNPPPRWLNCPRKGGLIAELFIPFKTPLDHKFDDEVPDECKFNIQMFKMSVNQSYKPREVGLIIDLTNTTRFYNKDEVESLGMNYVKLQCKGKDGPPEREQTLIFLSVVDKFIQKEPDKIIGVHCTHGFNRTGFLISSYLVERQDWSIEAAVQAFAQCREPGIYKGQYISELFRMYDEESAAPLAPQLPDWCNEEEEADDDGTEDSSSAGTSKRRREIVKPNPTFMEGVGGAIAVQDQPRLGDIQRKVQDMCEWDNSGFPGSQPVSIDMNNIKLLHEKRYYVSWKADGNRYMMLIDGPGLVFLIDRDNCVFHIKDIEFPCRSDTQTHLTNTLLDGELVIDEDKINNKKVPRYLIYDIIKFQGQDIGKKPFSHRLPCIQHEIIEPRHRKQQEGLLDRSKEPFGIRAKMFYDLSQETRVRHTKKLMSKEFASSLGHETDGLVLQPAGPNDVYKAGRQDDVLKWKPPHLNSIDFKLNIIKQQQLGMLAETKGWLFVGGMDPPIDQMKVTKDLHQYNNKIIECSWDFEKHGWKFMRERTDKSFPNAYKTAVAVIESIKNPVTEQRLVDFINKYAWRPPEFRKPAPPNQVNNRSNMAPPPKR